MLLLQTCLSLVRKYGPVAKVVTAGVLNVVAPGSGALVEMAGNALDAASETAEEVADDQFRRQLLDRLGQSEAELTRLGQLLEYLTGPLVKVCDKAAAFADQADDLPDIIGRAIAADPSLAQVLHQIGGLKEQFSVFQADIRRLADRQDEAAPVYARMNRVADYFDELWQAGIKPKEFVRLLHDRTRAVACIEQGQTGELDNLFLEMRTVAPKAASIPLLEAAASVREFNYPAAQRALATAVRLRPGDGELLELSRRVTTLATRSTPSQPRSPAPPAGPKRLQPGDTLDGWQLEERLGAGGWGQVFRAVRDGQKRALKVMHPELAADARFVQRFKQEIATLQRLPHHPNLVRIEDFGYCVQRQTWYLAMEYIDGPTLERYLTDKGPLTEAQVRKVFADVIDGLAQAHATGIVHRDIKPGNLIFRRSNQRLVFVDFGLAVGVEDFGRTRVGGISVQFAAPEQHYGESATQASDVFCLCAVIHYALNFDKPEQRKPNRFAPRLAPESLREALTRGLAHNLADRLADAGQLRQVFLSMAVPVEPVTPQAPTADPVTDYARWKQQVEELKAQSLRAADIYDYARAVAILEQVPAKHRDNALLAEWTRKRDRLAELWGHVESGWRDMSEDELCDQLGEIVQLHPDHPRAKPWLAQAASTERQKQRLRLRGHQVKIGDVIEVPLSGSVKMKFAWVPPGTSWLGGGDGKPGTQQFTLPQGLWCGVYPVTQAEWQAVMGDNPSHFGGKPQHPVESVSWNRVQEFLAAMNKKLSGSGLVYRLPTEAEWEYICRGGPISQEQSKYSFYFAKSKTDLTPAPTNDLSSRQANFNGNYPVGTAPKGPYLGSTSEVGLYLPNPLGIYDLHGNVWEWTSTEEGSVRVIRGGSWYVNGVFCTASIRFSYGPDDARIDLGCRLLAVPVG